VKRTPWREASAKYRKDPARAARIAEGTRAILDANALQRLRETRGTTQAALASALSKSQARVSQIERQEDLYLSTLDEYIRAMGGRLRMIAEFPDETVEIVSKSSDLNRTT
jgi:transcriptional regulator with XRE-family HTH domain